jgi:hypothetical protein
MQCSPSSDTPDLQSEPAVPSKERKIGHARAAERVLVCAAKRAHSISAGVGGLFCQGGVLRVLFSGSANARRSRALPTENSLVSSFHDAPVLAGCVHNTIASPLDRPSCNAVLP